MGNGVAFTHAEEMIEPLFAFIRHQYFLFRLRPVLVYVVVFLSMLDVP